MKKTNPILFVLLISFNFCQAGNLLDSVTSDVNKKQLEILISKICELGYSAMPQAMQTNLLAETQDAQGTSPRNKFGTGSLLCPKVRRTPTETPLWRRVPIAIGKGEVFREVRGEVFQSIDKSITYYTLSSNHFPEIQTAQNNLAESFSSNSKIDATIFALSIDPLSEKFPSQSPYLSMSNNPINRIDPDGKADVTATNIKTMTQKFPKSIYQSEAAALFALVSTVTDGNSVSGAELVKSFNPDFLTQHPQLSQEIASVENISNAGGRITITLKTGIDEVDFGEDGKGYIVVSNHASFQVSSSSSDIIISKVSNISLCTTTECTFAGSTGLQSAIINSHGVAKLDGKLKDTEIDMHQIYGH